MNYVNEDVLTLDRVSISNMLQKIGREEVITEILAGLLKSPKAISSKYFYNRKGSLLFEENCSQPDGALRDLRNH